MGWVRAPLWPDKQVRTRYRGDVGVVEEDEVAVVVASEKIIVAEGACNVVEDFGLGRIPGYCKYTQIGAREIGG